MGNKNVALMRGEPEIAVKKLAIPIMISMILLNILLNSILSFIKNLY